MSARCTRPTGLRRLLSRLAEAAGAEKLVCDPCGIVMAGFAWFLLLWGNYRGWLYADFDSNSDVALFALYQCLALLALTAHFKAMCSDPGTVPFRSPGAPPLRRIDRDRPEWVSGELVTTCFRCDVYKPFRAHHCSVCQRCVRMMDHHCPWVNNCVGERNHKFFVQFCAYIFFMAIVGAVILARFLMRCPVRWHRCLMASPWEPLAMLLFVMEIMLFGLFTLIMACDQAWGIAADTTTLERMRGGPAAKPPSVRDNFRRVFAGGSKRASVATWLLPVHPAPARRDKNADARYVEV